MVRTKVILDKAFLDVQNIVKNLDLKPEQKEKAAKEVIKAKEKADKSAGSPFAWDEWIYRIAIMVLGFVIIIAIIGTIWLTLAGIKELPSILIALGSASVGAIAGLLTPTSASKEK
jgi:uncharacterized integral membrane protein